MITCGPISHKLLRALPSNLESNTLNMYIRYIHSYSKSDIDRIMYLYISCIKTYQLNPSTLIIFTQDKAIDTEERIYSRRS